MYNQSTRNMENSRVYKSVPAASLTQPRATYVRLNRRTAPIRLDCGHVREGLSQLTTVRRGQGPVHGNSDPMISWLSVSWEQSREQARKLVHSSSIGLLHLLPWIPSVTDCDLEVRVK